MLCSHAMLVMLAYSGLCLVNSLFPPMLNHCTVTAAIRRGWSQWPVSRKWPFFSLIVPVVCNLDGSHEVECSSELRLLEKDTGVVRLGSRLSIFHFFLDQKWFQF